MADHVPVTPGVGASIATDDVGGVHYQIIKHAWGPLDTANILDDATGKRLPVKIGEGLPAGTNEIGAVVARRDLQRISVQSGGLTTSVTSYTAGDQVGTIFTVTNAARASGGGGTITGITLIDAADVIGTYDVVFFTQSVTLASDNAAFAISDADALNVIGIAQLAGSFDMTNNRIAQLFNLAIPYVCVGSTSLYAALITRSNHSFFAAATDLQLITYVERN